MNKLVHLKAIKKKEDHVTLKWSINNIKSLHNELACGRDENRDGEWKPKLPTTCHPLPHQTNTHTSHAHRSPVFITASKTSARQSSHLLQSWLERKETGQGLTEKGKQQIAPLGEIVTDTSRSGSKLCSYVSSGGKGKANVWALVKQKLQEIIN